jgi:hypothetical protein
MRLIWLTMAYFFKLIGVFMAKPAKQKVKLQDSDWEQLFPGKSFTIASTQVDIVPLSLQEISVVLAKLSDLANSLDSLNLTTAVVEEGVTPEAGLNILNLVSIIMDESPDILSDMSGVDVEDIKSLPLGTAVELFTFCLEVNIDSQESLVKNLSKLGDKVATFTGGTQKSAQTQRATIPLAN